MTDLTPPLDPAKSALLVMDYQPGIIGLIGDAAAEPLIERANAAIGAVRTAGGHVGYLRVGFDDAEIAAFPPTSRMGARIAQMGENARADSPRRRSTRASRRTTVTSSCARPASARSRRRTSTPSSAPAASTRSCSPGSARAAWS